MSSVERFTSQVPTNKLYVNIAAIQSSIFDATLIPATWVTNLGALGALSTPGNALLRDMGKTVYLPAPSGAQQSTVLRKIQLVANSISGNFGTGGTADVTGEYFTGYIELGGQTYGGGNGTPARVARLN
jgi:hypothetical protein